MSKLVDNRLLHNIGYSPVGADLRGVTIEKLMDLARAREFVSRRRQRPPLEEPTLPPPPPSTPQDAPSTVLTSPPSDANHARIDVVISDSQHKVPSLSSSVKAPPALQFGSLEPAMVKVLLADKGTMNEENYIDKFEEDGEWILVTRRRRQRHCIDELHPLFLKKSYSPTGRKPNLMKVLKTPHVNFKKPSKSNHRTPVTLDDFFPKKFFESKGALPLKTPTSIHVEKNQTKSVVVEHIPQLNPKGREIVADVHVEPGSTSKIQSKVTRSNDYQVMAKSLIMPITTVNSSPPNDSSPVKISCQKLQGTFSPKVYKLLEKSGYNFSNPSGLGKLEPGLTGEKIHGLTKPQHKLRKQGYQVDQPKTEGDGKGKKPSDNCVFVFDRLSTPTARPSVFGRLGSSSRIPNVQDRLGASSIPQSSPQGSKSSLVLITMDGTVKVKPRIISNSRRSNENNPNEDEVEVIISSNYAAVDEDSDPEASNDEIQEAPPQLEYGGQATVDELKELNLVTVPELVVSVTDEKVRQGFSSKRIRPCQQFKQIALLISG
ncbi:hypothetical protein BUALT_Bualt01G0169200 [Buddleja alternifolia]|uniref:Uncharacterized protein n=1 Tax=Buddleja alternifolia TaxID=168488 RepID=A0AAV6Y7W6_9LAMI|nr:hypothetical protein BUALT_Bualt01G0169200 [Buddleja alternifolia]